VRAAIPAVAKTLVFTVFVPGTVAGYVPWRLRQNAAAPVTGTEEWAAIAVITIGIAIYLYTAFWGFALMGGGTPAPIAPTKTLVVKGLHRFVRNPMSSESGSSSQGKPGCSTHCISRSTWPACC